MKAIIAYIKGIKWSIQNIKICLWIYLFNFLFAALAAYPLSSLLDSKLGRSLEIQHLMKGFDFTVYSDFMLQYGNAVKVILGQSQLLLLLYLPLSIFLVGGIAGACIKGGQFTNFQTFIKNSAHYFWRFFRLTFYFLLIHLFIAGIFWMIYSASVNGFDFKQLANENVVYTRGKIVLIAYALVASIFFLIQDYTKLYIARHDAPIVVKSIWTTTKIVFQNFFAYWALYALNALTFCLIFWLYWMLQFDDLDSTSTTIILTFLIGQVFIFTRIGMKVLNLASGTILLKKSVEA